MGTLALLGVRFVPMSPRGGRDAARLGGVPWAFRLTAAATADLPARYLAGQPPYAKASPHHSLEQLPPSDPQAEQRVAQNRKSSWLQLQRLIKMRLRG